MTFFARLLAAALALPQPYYSPGHEPETAAARAQRVEVIVSSAMSESHGVEGWPGTDEELAAAMLSVTWFESRRWALEVHDGARRGDHGASVCLAQIWTRDRSLAGTSPEATRRCFHRAAQILAMHAARCGIHRVDEMQMARLLGAYGTGRTCHTMPWARKRARLWARFMNATGEAPDMHALPQNKMTGFDDFDRPRRPARAKTITSIAAH
ncbi:MAG TPA: hypothetical protein VHC69_03370 [Polyangiaceae bacterium]|nr:hypothetical protein [Polyangiaceae bacterium]